MERAANANVVVVTYMAGLGRRTGLFEATGIGVEISDFARAAALDAPDRQELVERIRENLKPVRGPVSLHGPYRSMDPASPDAKIRAVCRDRYLRALEVAHAIGAGRIVLHTGYDPNYRSPAYDEGFVERSAEFYEELLREAGDGVRLTLENMFEGTAGPGVSLVDRLGGRIGLLFDTGHLNVYAKEPPAEWARKAAGRLEYLHLNDNDGQFDRHDAVGTGTFDYTAFFAAIEHRPTVAVEIKNFEELKASFRRLGELGIVDPAIAEEAGRIKIPEA